MKTLKFSPDSWHFRFIDKYTSYQTYDLDNICIYTRAFIVANLVFALKWVAIAGLCSLAVQILMGVGFSLFYGMLIFTEAAVIAMLAIAFATTVFGGIWGIERWTEHRREKRWANYQDGIEAPDSFVVNAYKSWKEKWCARVEIIRPVQEEGPAEY